MAGNLYILAGPAFNPEQDGESFRILSFTCVGRMGGVRKGCREIASEMTAVGGDRRRVLGALRGAFRAAEIDP
jgi:hypothetical protein